MLVQGIWSIAMICFKKNKNSQYWLFLRGDGEEVMGLNCTAAVQKYIYTAVWFTTSEQSERGRLVKYLHSVMG